MFDIINYSGAYFIEWLQGTPLPTGPLIFASILGDPPVVSLLAFPFAFFLHPILGVATLLSTAFSEWINGIIKLLLFGDRPYWWVMVHKAKNINLRQFPMTCETGPGSPSGHCMVAMAGWLPLVIFLLNRYQRFKIILATLFVAFMSILCCSRLYVAAHFPHQVIGGVFGGLVIGVVAYAWAHPYLINNNGAYGRRTYNEKRSSILLSPLWLMVIAAVSFGITRLLDAVLIANGIDINWSYTLAEKACQNRKWVNPSTSLSAAYARISGLLLGLAVAFVYRPAMPHCSPAASTTLKRAVITSAFSILAVVTMNNLFVSASEVASTTIPFLISFVATSLTDTTVTNTKFLIWMALKAMICPVIVALCLPTMLARGCVRQFDGEWNNANQEQLLTRGEFVSNLLDSNIVQLDGIKRRSSKKKI